MTYNVLSGTLRLYTTTTTISRKFAALVYDDGKVSTEYIVFVLFWGVLVYQMFPNLNILSTSFILNGYRAAKPPDFRSFESSITVVQFVNENSSNFTIYLR